MMFTITEWQKIHDSNNLNDVTVQFEGVKLLMLVHCLLLLSLCVRVLRLVQVL